MTFIRAQWLLTGVLGTSLLGIAPALAQPAPAPPAPAQPAAADDAAPAPAEPSRIELRKAPENQLSVGEALAPQPDGLTADEVAQKALASNPTLDARQAEIAVADAKVDAAVAQFLPRLTLTASYTRTSPVDSNLGGALVGALNEGPILVGPCPNPAMGDQCVTDSAGQPIGAASFSFPSLVNHYSLNARLALPLSDYVLRLSDSLTATRANRRAAEIQKEAETLKVAADARVAYYNWLRTVAGGVLANNSLERFQAMLKDARTAFEVGAATKADVLRLEAAVAATELAITESDAIRSLMEEQLATLMNEPVRQYHVGEAMTIDPSQVRATGQLAALVAEAQRRRLELQALNAASRALRAGADAASVSQYPRLDAFGDVTYANPNPQIFPQRQEWNHTWAVGLSLTWTVNDAFAGRAQAAELDATRIKLEADRKNLLRGIKLEVTAAYFDVKKARAAITTSARSSAAAREAYRVARDLYQVGRATTTDLIQAESELAAASVKEIDAALNYRVAQLKLNHAVGRDAPSAS
jgi:outer membrane protein TolC